MEFCPRCDARNPQGTVACRSCGAAMGQGTLVMGAEPMFVRPRVALRVVRADGGPEAQIPMTGDQLLCGRRGEVALSEDPFVAEKQARFFFTAGRLAVEDVGGGNGVFVRLRGEHELPVGAELRLGRQRLLVEAVPPAVASVDGAMAWGSPDPGYRFRLVQLLEGGARGAAFPLVEGDNALGREAGNVCFPTDGFVSGRHAMLTVQGGRLVVRDLGSSNGTFARLATPTFLEDGDQLLVGRQLVRVDVKPAA
jgi:pSer/pThr/pTyr-binding forkhead associated (FHA) protein